LQNITLTTKRNKRKKEKERKRRQETTNREKKKGEIERERRNCGSFQPKPQKRKRCLKALHHPFIPCKSNRYIYHISVVFTCIY